MIKMMMTTIIKMITMIILQKYQQSDQEEHEQLFALIHAMLTYDPVERIGLDQVLR